MKNPSGHSGKRTANPALQTLHIRSRFPQFRHVREGKDHVWRGTLQPQSVSAVYDIVIRYREATIPRVFVARPTLVPGAPHRYVDGSLCLYWPREWRWSRDALIAETILPWTAAWLVYYELWLDCGEWLGPEAEHGRRKRRG